MHGGAALVNSQGVATCSLKQYDDRIAQIFAICVCLSETVARGALFTWQTPIVRCSVLRRLLRARRCLPADATPRQTKDILAKLIMRGIRTKRWE